MTNNLQKKIKQYLFANQELLNKHKLALRGLINFPTRKKVPLLSRIAMKILVRQGARIDIEVISK